MAVGNNDRRIGDLGVWNPPGRIDIPVLPEQKDIQRVQRVERAERSRDRARSNGRRRYFIPAIPNCKLLERSVRCHDGPGVKATTKYRSDRHGSTRLLLSRGLTPATYYYWCIT
eukprot:766883-Hanusia_phi.AAC.9